MRRLFTISGVALGTVMLALGSAADAAPVTLMCQSTPTPTSHVQNEPDILIVDETAATVDFTEGAWHYAPPLVYSRPTRHVGTFTATFGQNEIAFRADDLEYRLNRVSGSFTAYNIDGERVDRDMICHPQQRQF